MFDAVDQYVLTGCVGMGFAAVAVCFLSLWFDEPPLEAVKEE